MSPKRYVNVAVINFEKNPIREGKKIPLKCVTTLYRKYSPQLKESTELKVNCMQGFKEFISQLLWEVEIGHVEIIFDKSLL